MAATMTMPSMPSMPSVHLMPGRGPKRSVNPYITDLDRLHNGEEPESLDLRSAVDLDNTLSSLYEILETASSAPEFSAMLKGAAAVEYLPDQEKVLTMLSDAWSGGYSARKKDHEASKEWSRMQQQWQQSMANKTATTNVSRPQQSGPSQQMGQSHQSSQFGQPNQPNQPSQGPQSHQRSFSILRPSGQPGQSNQSAQNAHHSGTYVPNSLFGQAPSNPSMTTTAGTPKNVTFEADVKRDDASRNPPYTFKTGHPGSKTSIFGDSTPSQPRGSCPSSVRGVDARHHHHHRRQTEQDSNFGSNRHWQHYFQTAVNPSAASQLGTERPMSDARFPRD